MPIIKTVKRQQQGSLMINIIYKKLLITLYLCFFATFNIFSMQTMKDFEESLKQPNRDLNQLRQLATDLSKDKKNYHRISLLLHPDRTNGDTDLQEIQKYANDSYAAANKPVPTNRLASKDDIERVRILNEVDQINESITTKDTFSIPMTILANNATQTQHAIINHLIDKTVDATFTFILRTLPSEYLTNTDLHNELNTQKNDYETTNETLRMHTEYRNDLLKIINKTNESSRKKLNSYRKKEKK